MIKSTRIRGLETLIVLCFLIVTIRLFYWQVLARNRLEAIASFQHQSTIEIPASRGRILASDGYPLVDNQPAFLAFAYMPDITDSPMTISQQIAPLIQPTPQELNATPSAELNAQLLDQTIQGIESILTTNLSWVQVARGLNFDEKTAIQNLHIPGIGYEEYQVRHYPEASLSAQLLGFVGSDGTGKPKGYFGLEGYYDLELTGKPGLIKQEKDALGRPIIIGDFESIESVVGRTLHTHIDRSIQLVVEKELIRGIEKYQAKSGDIIVMDPHTGAILAMASYPSYDPEWYKLYPSENYRIPSISDTYEPGSTFKSLVMSAGIDAGVVTPDTPCDSTCDGPVQVGKFQVRTWNNEYHPGTTMLNVLEQSDNTGMIFVAFRLGKDKFVDYLHQFGIGQATKIDLEAESVPELRDSWGDIDLATGSFGQGLAVTPIQMISAVASIANFGKRMQPQVVDQVTTANDSITIEPKVLSQPISPESAQIMKEMLIKSGHKNSYVSLIPKGYQVAGKSGTAQIPIEGHYDTEKTIASFVGFAPANNPRFAMIVKLREPQTSPWSEDTAKPLWFAIAHELFRHFHLAPISDE